MHEIGTIWDKIHLRQGALDLVVLPGLGGRLWDIRLGGQSLLFQNPDLHGIDVDLSTLDHLPTRSPQFGFPLWGGEKTWLAPETDWPGGAPHPVLDSGRYEIRTLTNRTIGMTSAPCPISNLVIDREITLLSDSSWTITHRLQNTGKAPRVCGIWSVMMLDHPTKIGVPGQDIHVTDVFDEHEGHVTRPTQGVVTNCIGKNQFKIAMDNPHGAALLCVTHEPIWLLCRTPALSGGEVFAHGKPFEVFNSGDYSYCEAEWHSPQTTLAPDGTLTFQQTFHVWQGVALPAQTPLTQSESDLMQCMS